MTRSVVLIFSILTLSVIAEIRPLMVGDKIPAANLMTMEGDSFDLKKAAKENRLAIIYYRGGWCPYCNKHLGHLQKADPELQKLGYRIIAISADKPSKVRESHDDGNVTYTLLSDASMETAKAFGIAFEVDAPMIDLLTSYNIDIEEASGEKHHLLPVPSVFLVGTDGIIDFVYANPDYKVRLETDVLLSAAKAAMESDER